MFCALEHRTSGSDRCQGANPVVAAEAITLLYCCMCCCPAVTSCVGLSYCTEGLLCHVLTYLGVSTCSGKLEWQSPATSFPAQGMVVSCQILRKTQSNLTTSISFDLQFHFAFQNTVRMRFIEHDFPLCRTGGRVWVRHLVINLCSSLFAFSLV